MKKLLYLGIIFLICNDLTFSQTYNPTVIYTPTGKTVNAWTLASADLTQQQKNDIKNFWLNCYNNRITYINEATYKYNCHGYAWYVSGGGTLVWINTPEQKKFWQCGGYAEVSPSIATKVSFGGPCYEYRTTCEGTYYGDYCDHSAIATTTPGVLRSKW